jgi:hypothetical protein
VRGYKRPDKAQCNSATAIKNQIKTCRSACGGIPNVLTHSSVAK